MGAFQARREEPHRAPSPVPGAAGPITPPLPAWCEVLPGSKELLMALNRSIAIFARPNNSGAM